MPAPDTCPHLGLADDPQTALAYPSEWNLCYHCRPARPADLEHQSRYCLAPGHSACPIFLAAGGAAMPAALRLQATRRSRRRPAIVFALLALLALTLGGAAWMAERARQEARYLGTSAVETAVMLHLQPVAGDTDTPLAGTSTATPAASDTAEPPASPPGTTRGLDQVIGRETRFIIHRIATGENIALLAERYNTTDAAIVAVNYVLPVPIWVDWVVVIPIERTDVAGLPPFEPYQVQADITAEALVAELNTGLDDFIAFNDLQPGELLQTGDWVLVPRPAGEN